MNQLDEAFAWLWTRLLHLKAKSGLSSNLFMVVAVSGSHECTYVLTSLFYFLVSLIPALNRYKIQPDQSVPATKITSALLYVYFNRLFIQLPLGTLSLFLWERRGGSMDMPLPSAGGVLWQVCLCMIIMEVWFYSTHRFFHWGPMYRRFHKRHHEFTTSVAIAAEYAHPVEDVIVNLGSTLGPPVLLGVHPLAFIFYVVVRIYESVEAHCGYAVPWSPWHMLPYAGGPEAHDFHHRFHNKGCYGAFFMDWLLGTDREFRAFKAKQKEGRRDNTTTKPTARKQQQPDAK